MKISTKGNAASPKAWPRIRIWLALASLLPCLTFCAGAKPRPIPPAELLAPIQIPDRAAVKTVGDLARLALADERAMALKNNDLAALRQWFAEAGHD